MIIVAETPQAVRSAGVDHEVAATVKRRLRLAAVQLQPGPLIGEIDELALDALRVWKGFKRAAGCSTTCKTRTGRRSRDVAIRNTLP